MLGNRSMALVGVPKADIFDPEPLEMDEVTHSRVIEMGYFWGTRSVPLPLYIPVASEGGNKKALCFPKHIF